MSAAAPGMAVCPRDGTALVEVERSGVLIDACPTCRGMWLDRGELEKLVTLEGGAASDEDFLSEVTGKRSNAGPARAEDDESRASGRKRRGSLLQNFLDFGGE